MATKQPKTIVQLPVYSGSVNDSTLYIEIGKSDGTSNRVPLPEVISSGPKGDKGDPGDQGIQGIAGTNGLKGDKGDTGEKGDTGAAGAAGAKGDAGAAGTNGTDGATGPKGDKGDTGAAGAKGDTGSQGLPGIQGLPGAKGDKGDTGNTGLQGNDGPQGPKGDQGDEGPKGDTGAAGTEGLPGTPGVKGDKGDKGDTGEKGEQGVAGPKGEDGVDGVTGLKGDKGDKGDTGSAGEPGLPGLPASIVGSVPTIADLPDPTDYSPGDTYIIGTKFYTQIEGAWTNVGDFTGPKGTDGIGLRILGSFATIGDLPVSGAAAGDSYIIDSTMWVWDTENWVPVGQVGPQGIQGNVGPMGPQGNVGPKGDKGDTGDVGPEGPQGIQGEDGPMGPGIKILGAVANEEALPDSGVTGEGYLIGGNFWGWTGTAFENMGPIQGPQGIAGPKGDKGDIGNTGPAGEQGIQGIQGNEGTKGDKGDTGNVGLQGPKGDAGADGVDGIDGAKGDQGEKGDKGDPGDEGPVGATLLVLGTLASVADLPATGNEKGDAYVIDGNLHSFNGTGFVDGGPFRGPEGPKGDTGETGTAGAPGAEGPVGPSITPKGVVATVDDLPAAGNVKGDAYTVTATGNQHVYDGAAFINQGQFRGPKGDQGIQGVKGDQGVAGNDGGDGPQGIPGTKGDKGDQGDAGTPGVDGTDGEDGAIGKGLNPKGSLVDQAALDAIVGMQIGDLYYVAGRARIYDGATWGDFGYMVGPQGPEGPRGNPGVKGDTGTAGEYGTRWIVLDRAPTTIDGRLGDFYMHQTTLAYYQKTSETVWSQLGTLGGGNVYDAPVDGILRGRKDAGWAPIPVLEAPSNVVAAQYTRSGAGAWKRFNRYDVGIATVTTAIDMADVGAVIISANVAKTLTFANVPPAGRAAPFMVKILGNAGVITWPAGIKWTGGANPKLEATYTLVGLFWDGSEWTGGVAQSA